MGLPQAWAKFPAELEQKHAYWGRVLALELEEPLADLLRGHWREAHLE